MVSRFLARNLPRSFFFFLPYTFYARPKHAVIGNAHLRNRKKSERGTFPSCRGSETTALCSDSRTTHLQCHRRFDANYTPSVRYGMYRYFLRYRPRRPSARLPVALRETFSLEKISFPASHNRSSNNMMYSTGHSIENRRCGVNHANRIIHKSLGTRLGSLPRNSKPTLYPRAEDML